MANSLGRGLGSLIPPKVKKITDSASGEPIVELASDDDKNRMLMLEPDKIDSNPLQPRRKFSEQPMSELVESIKRHGIIQPLIVSRRQDESGPAYELIAGERRLRAAKMAGIKKIPVIVRPAKEQEKLELALIENLQREDLNPIDMALAYRKLLDEFNLNQEELAQRVGKARSSLTNALRYLRLPQVIQQALIDGNVSEGHAKVIAGLDSEEKQLALFNKIIRRAGYTVSDAAEETRRMGGTKLARVKINYADKDKEFALRQFFGCKVEIKRRGRLGQGGKIIIDFYSDEELDEIIGKIRG